MIFNETNAKLVQEFISTRSHLGEFVYQPGAVRSAPSMAFINIPSLPTVSWSIRINNEWWEWTIELNSEGIKIQTFIDVIEKIEKSENVDFSELKEFLKLLI